MIFSLRMKLLSRIPKARLIEMKNAKQWQSTGYASNFQCLLQEELFYRSYEHIHGKEVARTQYATHAKLREIVAVQQIV